MKQFFLFIGMALIMTACNNTGGVDGSTDGTTTNDTTNPMNNTMTNPQNDINTPPNDSINLTLDSLKQKENQ